MRSVSTPSCAIVVRRRNASGSRPAWNGVGATIASAPIARVPTPCSWRAVPSARTSARTPHRRLRRDSSTRRRQSAGPAGKSRAGKAFRPRRDAPRSGRARTPAVAAASAAARARIRSASARVASWRIDGLLDRLASHCSIGTPGSARPVGEATAAHRYPRPVAASATKPNCAGKLLCANRILAVIVRAQEGVGSGRSYRNSRSLQVRL